MNRRLAIAFSASLVKSVFLLGSVIRPTMADADSSLDAYVPNALQHGWIAQLTVPPPATNLANTSHLSASSWQSSL